MVRVELQIPESTTGRADELLSDMWERHDGDVGPMVRAMTEPAVAAIVAFARRFHLAPSAVDDDTLAGLRAHGYRDRDLLDVVGLVALDVMTGSFNLVAGIEPAPTPA